MNDLCVIIVLICATTSISACYPKNNTAQNNKKSDYKQEVYLDEEVNDLNVENDKNFVDGYNIALEKNKSKYFTLSEIRGLSQAFIQDSCDMTKFDQQTKKYKFSNNYGNPYVDGQESINELNESSRCLLIQHAKIDTFNNRFSVDDKNSNKLKSIEVDLRSNIINKIVFSIDYSKFPSCNMYQKESPFIVVFLKNDLGKIERSIVKSEHENFNCYENAMNNMLEVNKSSYEIDEKWQGLYNYSTYQTVESKGQAFGENYTIMISNDECNIDIVGYQVDSHFTCFVIQNEDSNYISIYQLDNNDKFGEVKYTQPNIYSINLTYYDEFDEPDNNFYSLEKK